MDEVPLLELMPEHCLKIAALIFYCALDCLIKKTYNEILYGSCSSFASLL